MSRPLDYARPSTRGSQAAAVVGWISFACGVAAAVAFVILPIAMPWVLLGLYLAVLGCGLCCAFLAAAFGNRSWTATAGLLVNVILAVVTMVLRFSL